MAKHKRTDDTKPPTPPAATAPAPDDDWIATPPVENRGRLVVPPEAIVEDVVGNLAEQAKDVGCFPPPPSVIVDPLDVPTMHRLRVSGRLWRVKQKHPAVGQVLVEAGTGPEAVTLSGIDPATCKAEQLKP